MIKKLREETVHYIQFTEEEISELGFEENQKFEVSCEEDGSILLKPFTKLEIDLEDLPKSTLIHLISESCDKDISMNEVFSDILERVVDGKSKGLC